MHPKLHQSHTTDQYFSWTWRVSRARVLYTLRQRERERERERDRERETDRTGMEGFADVQQGHNCSAVEIWGFVAFVESAPLQIFAQIETNCTTGI